MLAIELTTFRIQKIVFLAAVALPALVAVQPAVLTWIRDRPRLVVGALVVADLAFFLWATVPFVPIGVDECLFAVNARALRGDDLPVSWIRNPLPVCGAAAFPWHPPLGGLLCRGVAIACAFLLARRALGPACGVLAAWWTMIAGHLGMYGCRLLSEPYGAACFAAFAVLLVSRRWFLAALVGGLAFTSRWQLGILLLPVLVAGWGYGRGFRGALVSTVAFAAPVALLSPLTGADPWRAFQQESSREATVLERLAEYAKPENGFGLGIAGLALLLVGIWSQRSCQHRHPAITWCAALFVLFGLGVIGIGVATTRFFAPAVPLGVVVMAAGAVQLRHWLPSLGRPLVLGPTLAGVAVAIALPARVPKTRFEKQASLARVVHDHRDEIAAHVGSAPLYTDYDVLEITAVLGRRSRAVHWERSQHPEGLSLSFEGEVPDVSRDAVPAGAFYLTFDPAGRQALWQRRDFVLVRW